MAHRTVVTRLLQARGSLSKRQSAAANRLLWTLLHRPPVEFQEARHAVGRSTFDEVVVPVIIRGESLASLSRRDGVLQALVSGKLRHAMDALAEHLLTSALATRAPIRSQTARRAC
jgi:hypothetical protein